MFHPYAQHRTQLNAGNAHPVGRLPGWQDAPEKDLLVMILGQSNADRHLVSPRPDSPLLDHPELYTLASGLGLGGYKYTLDGRTLRKSKALNREVEASELIRLSDLVGDHSFITHNLGAAALARGLVRRAYMRGAARGGATLRGWRNSPHRVTALHVLKDGESSPILDNMIGDIIALREHAETTRVHIVFVHGEADRYQRAGCYLKEFQALKSEVDRRVGALGLETHWHVLQSGGFTREQGGNDWQSRLANLLMPELCGPNLTLSAALYPYSMDDSVHPDARAKALIGEIAAASVEAVERGARWVNPLPAMWSRRGSHEIVLYCQSDEPLVIDPEAGCGPHHGFTVTPAQGLTLEDVRLEGLDQIVLRFAEPINEGNRRRVQLDYAFRRRRAGDDCSPAREVLGRGAIRSDWSRRSLLVEGETLHKWMPGFRLIMWPEEVHGEPVWRRGFRKPAANPPSLAPSDIEMAEAMLA